MTLREMVDATYYAARQTAAKDPSGPDKAALLNAIEKDCIANNLDVRMVIAAVEMRWLTDTIKNMENEC